MTGIKNEFSAGLKAGIPIGLGYFSVSFGFGIMAVHKGLPIWAGVLISLTNLTSAGQAAGVEVIASDGTMLEMALTQLMINARYFLMAVALSQHSTAFTRRQRLLAAYGITDEIFGVSIGREQPVTPWYMYGMILVAAAGWVSGTFTGAVCGDVLPAVLSSALGIMLYGMFIAVIIPPVRKSLANLAVIVIAAAVSCALFYFAPEVTAGFAIIISAFAAAGIMAVVRPVDEAEE